MHNNLLNGDVSNYSLASGPEIRRVTAKDVANLPSINGWMRACLAIVSQISCGSLIIVLPDGRRLRFDGAAPGATGVLVVKDLSFARKLLIGGGIGFAEAYLDGLWDTPDLRALLKVIALNNASIGAKTQGAKWLSALSRLRHTFVQRNSKIGARRNIRYHYDLGNDFYALWLDASMTYSSALFNAPGDSLEQAQRNKYRTLAKQLNLHPDHHLLEIGIGWGGFAEYVAAEIGSKVTGITISTEQYNFARKRIHDSGLNEKVNIVIQDYRDTSGLYDRIASIEMFEAVGEAYWPKFFAKIRDNLKPDGLAGIQLITIADQNFASYRSGMDFIQRYIFPGGMLPSPSALLEQISRANLTLRKKISFGNDYALTLHRWHDAFQHKWPEIERLGFDNRFRRMWSYYLAYCESGFASHNTDVVQMTLAKS